jgi:hypothetical protein
MNRKSSPGTPGMCVLDGTGWSRMLVWKGVHGEWSAGW